MGVGRFGVAGGVWPERRHGLAVSAWPVASWPWTLSKLPRLPETPFIHPLSRDIGHRTKIKGQALFTAHCVLASCSAPCAVGAVTPFKEEEAGVQNSSVLPRVPQ